MNELKLKNQVGLFLIISQFILIILVYIFYLFGGFEFDQMTTTIALMFPMLTIYTSGMLKFFISNKNISTRTSQVNNVTGEFVLITWFLIILFVTSLFAIIILKAFNYISDFEQFKTSLGIIESLFAGFTGAIISALLDD